MNNAANIIYGTSDLGIAIVHCGVGSKYYQVQRIQGGQVTQETAAWDIRRCRRIAKAAAKGLGLAA